MATTVAELYHWFRLYYLCRYGLPIDCLNLLYRITVIQTGMLFDLIAERYTARIALYEKMTPRQRYLYDLKQEMGK